ncbi:MAG: molybdopterin-containing oxidoreductase family protein [Desulforhopalus sp.]
MLETTVKEGVVLTMCRQCDSHCGIEVTIKSGRLEKILGDKSHPVSRGRVCPKAFAAIDLVYHKDRITKPLKKQKDGSFTEIPHDEAMGEISDKLTSIKKEHGARAAGFWTGEGVGFWQQQDYGRRFTHGFGSPNYFSAESVCYASRHIACMSTQGFYNSFPDYANADLTVFWGVNPPVSHLHYMFELEKSVKRGGKLVIIDPLATQTAKMADLFLQINPGSDCVLALGLARHLIAKDQYDKSFVQTHTIGFEDYARYVEEFIPSRVSEETGISEAQFLQLAEMIADAGNRVINNFGVCIEHQTNGVNTARAINMVSGLCGAIDVKGGEYSPVSLGAQPIDLYKEIPLEHLEPIGADQFPALYHFRKECHSLTAMDYMLGKGKYPLRAMVITGANPVLTNPNAAKVAQAFSSLDLLVVRELFMTKTAELADYIMPAASFLERSELHCFANAQRVSLSRMALSDPGIKNEYDFWHELAELQGFSEDFFPWEDEGQFNRWLLSGSKTTYDEVAASPYGVTYSPRVYNQSHKNSFATESGKYQFTSTVLEEFGHSPLPQFNRCSHPSIDYEFELITGARKRIYYSSRYRNIDKFKKRIPYPVIEIHPDDAKRLAVENDEKVTVESKINRIELRVKIIDASHIKPGVVQITHGWDEANVNLLTDDSDLDPISGFPNLKNVRVRIFKSIEGN